MLTDVAIKKLKLKDKIYKVADRDGMYATVGTGGQITFRYDYRLNGRRETLTIGRYGPDGISLAEARGVSQRHYLMKFGPPDRSSDRTKLARG